MWPDVIELRDFYSSPLGYVVRRMIRRKIRLLLSNTRRLRMMALGYPTPFLRYYREEAERVVALMPAEQGALSWSKKIPNIVVLTEELQLPLADRSIDVAIVIHSLEFTSSPRDMIREVWRVLADGGRLVVVVPNRLSIWSHLEKTPFGHGSPYTASQLSRFLKENNFAPLQIENALYIPPFRSRILLSMASAWEKLGQRWSRNLSGVIIIEASKQMYAPSLVEKVSWKKKVRLGGKVALPLQSD